MAFHCMTCQVHLAADGELHCAVCDLRIVHSVAGKTWWHWQEPGNAPLSTHAQTPHPHQAVPPIRSAESGTRA